MSGRLGGPYFLELARYGRVQADVGRRLSAVYDFVSAGSPGGTIETMLRKLSLALLTSLLAVSFVSAQSSSDQQQASDNNESSSKQTKVDLSAPPGDVTDHPYSTTGSADVTEMHPWNPHRADKDVEVGDFYYKRKNFRAAEDRFREALEFQSNHAEATYRLADVLEKEDKHDEAATYYTAYLRILPHGPRADESKKALERLGAPLPDTANAVDQPQPKPEEPEKKPVGQRLKDHFSDWCVSAVIHTCTHPDSGDKSQPQTKPEKK
jgi:tetratricopeptide (TPR) repeat protein